jgi:hypothetical protein
MHGRTSLVDRLLVLVACEAAARGEEEEGRRGVDSEGRLRRGTKEGRG